MDTAIIWQIVYKLYCLLNKDKEKGKKKKAGLFHAHAAHSAGWHSRRHAAAPAGFFAACDDVVDAQYHHSHFCSRAYGLCFYFQRLDDSLLPGVHHFSAEDIDAG